MTSAFARAARILILPLLLLLGGLSTAEAVDPLNRAIGSWYGHIDSADRPPRYLEIQEVEENDRGGYTALAVYGWGDGTVSSGSAEVVATPSYTSLELTAPTGAKLWVEFLDDYPPLGRYQAADQPVRSIRFERLRDAPAYASLIGSWQAQRDGETRVLNVKRTLSARDGTVLAVGELGFAEKPKEMRQLVAPITGDAAHARIRWTTSATAVNLERTKPNELTGTFRRTDLKPETVDTIVFQQGSPRKRP